MSEKVEVRGDVAQLISGNVNEAPRQNNVVNFNVGSDRGPVQMLTDLQRKRIAGLVRELCALTQEDTLDVYRVILTEFGAERMKDMPRERYHEVVAQVEQWINENKKGSQKVLTAMEALSAHNLTNLTDSSAQHYCSQCRKTGASYIRLQRFSFSQWALCGVFLLTSSLLLYNLAMATASPKLEEQQCYYEGKSYSVGSTMQLGESSLLECQLADAIGLPIWIRTRE